jgi:hypothetical protein
VSRTKDRAKRKSVDDDFLVYLVTRPLEVCHLHDEEQFVESDSGRSLRLSDLVDSQEMCKETSGDDSNLIHLQSMVDDVVKWKIQERPPKKCD